MKILYIHQFFKKPNEVGITRAYELSKRLVAMGHEVHIISSRSVCDVSDIEYVDGIVVHWANIEYSNYFGFLKRIFAFAKFSYSAYRIGRKIPTDVVYASSAPLTVVVPGVLLKRKLCTKLVLEIRDLWPDAPIAMKMLPWYFVRAARYLEKFAYENSEHIVALTPGMKEGILKRNVPGAKVTVITNCADLKKIHPGVDGKVFREKIGCTDKFVVLQAGAMGPLYGLDFVIDTAKVIWERGYYDIRFVLVGDGKDRPRLVKRVISEDIRNVIFTDPVKKDDIPIVLAGADVCLNICINREVVYTASPNKLFEGLAAGRPIITNMPGWMRETVETGSAGLFVRPEFIEDFYDAVIKLYDNPDLREIMGKNARLVAESKFDFDVAAARLDRVLKSAVARSDN